MVGYRQVVLAVRLRRESEMASGLAADRIAEDLECPSQGRPGEIPREFHAEMTSSWTKCRRMTFGPPSPK